MSDIEALIIVPRWKVQRMKKKMIDEEMDAVVVAPGHRIGAYRPRYIMWDKDIAKDDEIFFSEKSMGLFEDWLHTSLTPRIGPHTEAIGLVSEDAEA